MKKARRDSKQPPCWHPDFRDPAGLPDVKVVRTSFFLNASAIVVFCTLLIVFFYREYETRGIKEQVQSWEMRIEERRPQNQEVVALSRDFRAESQRLEQVIAFVNAPIQPSEFLAEIARTIPDRIVLSRLNYRTAAGGPQVALAGRVLGTSEEATDIVSNYELLFTEHPYFERVVRGVSVTSVARIPDSDTLSFSFQLTLSDGS